MELEHIEGFCDEKVPEKTDLVTKYGQSLGKILYEYEHYLDFEDRRDQRFKFANTLALLMRVGDKEEIALGIEALLEYIDTKSEVAKIPFLQKAGF